MEEKPERPPRLHLLIVWGVAALLCALRVLPYLTSESGDPERVFLGFPYSIEDTLQYADFVAQAKDGAFLLSDRFTLANEDPRLIILPFWLTGNLARLFRLPVAAAWLLVHALLILAFTRMLYWFLKPFFPSPRARLLSFLFLIFAGGLDGWVALGHGLLPDTWATVLKKDLWPVLGWTPYMTSYNPLYLAGWLLLLPFLRLVLRAGHKTWTLLLAGALLPILFLNHAYDAVVGTGAVVLASFQPLLLRLEGRTSLRLLVRAVQLLPGLAATAAIALWQLGDPLFVTAAAAGNSGLFVSPLSWLLGFGGILLCACWGMPGLGAPTPRSRLLFGWLLATSLLSFSPVFEGRHFLYFVSLPLMILACDGLITLKSRLFPECLPRGARRLGLAAALLVLFGSSFIRITISNFTVPLRDERAYASADEVSIARALRDLPPGGVLCSRETGNWLPHLSRRRVAMGHWFMTPDLFGKRAAFQLLLDPATAPADRDRLLAGFGARYLFYGPRERVLGPIPITEHLMLTPRIGRGQVTVFEIGGL